LITCFVLLHLISWFSHANEFDEESLNEGRWRRYRYERFTIHGIRDFTHRFKAKFPDKQGNRYYQKGRFISVYYDSNYNDATGGTSPTMDEEVLRNTHLKTRSIFRLCEYWEGGSHTSGNQEDSIGRTKGYGRIERHDRDSLSVYEIGFWWVRMPIRLKIHWYGAWCNYNENGFNITDCPPFSGVRSS
jgi:hypothetical protein